ncbi:MAG TPA: cytochrome c oxidase, cbb3-type, CcoQ subunit [Sulfuricurvum sp.]|nr:cytochrome c oxidase, cbb3-type, CcoQ subunit [Sulfuricurvum sp.]
MDIATLQAYGFFFFTAFMVVLLYSYIYHLYSSQKKGTRDYEKYSNLALHDEITDQPIEEVISEDNETKK